MYDDYYHRDRSPGRSKDYPPRAYRDGDGHRRDRNDSYQSGQDHVRSAARQEYPPVGPEGYTHRHREFDRRRDYDEDRRGRSARQRDDWRPSRNDDWGERQYQGMYDEGYRGGADERRRPHRSYDSGGSLSPRERRHRYIDHTNENERPPRRHHRSRSRSRSYDAGKPTRTVMLEGLPLDISTIAVRDGLLGNSIAAEFPSFDVRVATSKEGRCRAFVQFQELDQAMSFIAEHSPKLLLTLPHTTYEVPDGTLSTYIHYARNSSDDYFQKTSGAPCNDWTCAQCQFFNFSTRSKCKKCMHPAPVIEETHKRTGESDAGREVDKKVQILVVYPLPRDMDEDKLATEMLRLEIVTNEKSKDGAVEAPKLRSTAPSADGAGFGARPGSLHRVFLMRDVATGDKLRYGFAEFWTLSDALAALKKYQMTRSFEIAGTPVTIASIHLGVFLPVDHEVTAENEAMSFTPLFNPLLRVQYRDPQLYPSQKMVAAEPPAPEDKVVKTDKNEAPRQKKRKAEGDAAENVAQKAPMMASQLAFWRRRHQEIHDGSGTGEERTAADPSQSAAASDANPSGPIKFSLSAPAKPATSQKPTVATSSSSPKTGAGGDSSGAAAADAPVSYVDRDRLMCLICMMRYKSVEDVDKHEKSANHRKATEDEDKVKAALPRLAARDKRVQQAQNGAQYRDRAKERREAYNQPEKPSGKAGGSKARAEAQERAPAQAAQAAPSASGAAAGAGSGEAKTAAESKGAGMLAKMGWTTGSGLGAQSRGLTEALTAQAYREGVGLGASDGKLGDAQEVAEGRTKDGPASYVTAAQERARQRYRQME